MVYFDFLSIGIPSPKSVINWKYCFLYFNILPNLSTRPWFVVAKALDLPVSSPTVSDQADPIHVIVPFKHQGSAHIVCAQIKDLTQKIHTTVQSVFVNQKI